MPELSNLLRQRLAARAASGEEVRTNGPVNGAGMANSTPEAEVHPDADILTAYVERLLPAQERSRVVEHLSACSQCREVVMLSLPESSPASGAAEMPAPAPRLWR